MPKPTKAVRVADVIRAVHSLSGELIRYEDVAEADFTQVMAAYKYLGEVLRAYRKYIEG